MIKWIRASRLSIKKSLSEEEEDVERAAALLTDTAHVKCVRETQILVAHAPPQGVLACDHAGRVINKLSSARTASREQDHSGWLFHYLHAEARRSGWPQILGCYATNRGALGTQAHLPDSQTRVREEGEGCRVSGAGGGRGFLKRQNEARENEMLGPSAHLPDSHTGVPRS